MRQRAPRLAPELLDRVATKVLQRGKRLGRRSDEELHALRKSLKKLRYGVDDLAGLYRPKAVKAYLRGCKELQKLLGSMRTGETLVAGDHKQWPKNSEARVLKPETVAMMPESDAVLAASASLPVSTMRQGG